jgi:hypothetical protein
MLFPQKPVFTHSVESLSGVHLSQTGTTHKTFGPRDDYRQETGQKRGKTRHIVADLPKTCVHWVGFDSKIGFPDLIGTVQMPGDGDASHRPAA